MMNSGGAGGDPVLDQAMMWGRIAADPEGYKKRLAELLKARDAADASAAVAAGELRKIEAARAEIDASEKRATAKNAEADEKIAKAASERAALEKRLDEVTRELATRSDAVRDRELAADGLAKALSARESAISVIEAKAKKALADAEAAKANHEAKAAKFQEFARQMRV